METSTGTRWLVLGILFAGMLIVVYGNFRLFAFLVLRRKVSRAAKIIWPALGLLAVFSVIDAFRIEPNWIQATHHTVETPKLKPGARIRIVQLADIHLLDLGVREIQMANLTAQERPDVIVLTGDHTIVKTAQSARQLRDLARRLADIAPCYAIDGNWDVATDMIALRQGGVTPLEDWTVVRSRDGRASVALNKLSWMQPDVFPVPEEWRRHYTIALRHMPNAFDQAAEAGYDLMLAGHTHGGQVRLPIFGALIPHPTLVGKYQAGMYRRDESLLYVSRGIGLEARPAPQLRFLCRPEIAVIDIAGKRR